MSTTTFKDRLEEFVALTEAYVYRGGGHPKDVPEKIENFVTAKADLLLYHHRFVEIIKWLAQHHYRVPTCGDLECEVCRENRDIINRARQLLIEEEIELCRTF